MPRLSALPHLIAVDRARARTRFLELYDLADRDFDLARCNALIGLLLDNASILGNDLNKDVQDRHRYYQVRSLFVEEYYQTATYYERSGLMTRLEKLLRDKKKWILHLHASGGMGKTMFLRWLAARHAVVRHSAGRALASTSTL